MGRKAWIWTLATLALIAIVTGAWIDGGLRQRQWIEQPIEVPTDAR